MAASSPPSFALRLIYNILFSLFFCLSAPFYFLKMWRRGNWRRGFSQRFGRHDTRLKQALTNRHVLWIHAVSVGEVNLCTQLIQALQERLPNIKIVVSTTTSTGMGELRRRLPAHIERIYYPIDFPRPVWRTLSLINPEAVILVEAEIWPNFLWALRKLRTPLFLVNARLSERSFKGYRRFGFLFRPIFNQFTGVGAQRDEDAHRLAELGVPKEAIHVVGSLKFDAATLQERRLLDVPALLAQIGVPADATILLGGSTHDGEELILGRIFKTLQPQIPNLFLVLVPRHFERGREVGQAITNLGIPFAYRNEITPTTTRPQGSVHTLIVNTTGELRFFYEHASLIFVGKSLAARGGQNPIEPAALGKPILFGPHMDNFQAIASAFIQAEGAVCVQNEEELLQQTRRLLLDPAARTRLGENALAVVKRNRGALDRTVDMILQGMHPDS